MPQTSVSVKRLNKFFNSSQLEKYVTRNEDPDDVISIDKGTFTWNTKDETDSDDKTDIPVANTLIDIDIKVKKGSLVAVVGSGIELSVRFGCDF